MKLITSNWYQSNGDEGISLMEMKDMLLFLIFEKTMPDSLHTHTEIHIFSL